MSWLMYHCLFYRCPASCQCVGLLVYCQSPSKDVIDNSTDMDAISLPLSPTTRLLDISYNGQLVHQSQFQEQDLHYLAHLNLSFCDLTKISRDFFQNMPNLKVLDISYNKLIRLSSLTLIRQKLLQVMFLNGNMEILTLEPQTFFGLVSIRNLTLSKLHIRLLSRKTFASLTLNTLKLYETAIDIAEDNAFEGLQVENLYINTSRVVDMSRNVFTGIENLQLLFTDSYKFCCVKPISLSSKHCYPEEDEFSSCTDLMKNDVLRTLIWLEGSFILLSNCASLVYRFVYDRARLKLGYGIFVSNLAVSDFLMGVFLIIIAGADVFYRGQYIFKAEAWRISYLCNIAGFCSFVSIEATVLFICLISVDRYLVIKYPFGQIRITQNIGNALAAIAWLLGVLMAAMPFIITPYFNGEFYSQTGICLALPLTRNRSPGWVYSFGIFIVFNTVIFVLIALGQLLIYMAIRESRKGLAGQHSSRSGDLKVTRNLLLVVMTNFLCWFPIGSIGKFIKCLMN